MNGVIIRHWGRKPTLFGRDSRLLSGKGNTLLTLGVGLTQVGCSGCSFQADNLPSHLGHLNSRDTTLVMVSRAPYETITKFKQRMGWPFPWVSSYENDFNYDFHVTQDENITPIFYNVRALSYLPSPTLPNPFLLKVRPALT